MYAAKYSDMVSRILIRLTEDKTLRIVSISTTNGDSFIVKFEKGASAYNVLRVLSAYTYENPGKYPLYNFEPTEYSLEIFFNEEVQQEKLHEIVLNTDLPLLTDQSFGTASFSKDTLQLIRKNNDIVKTIFLSTIRVCETGKYFEVKFLGSMSLEAISEAELRLSKNNLYRLSQIDLAGYTARYHYL